MGYFSSNFRSEALFFMVISDLRKFISDLFFRSGVLFFMVVSDLK